METLFSVMLSISSVYLLDNLAVELRYFTVISYKRLGLYGFKVRIAEDVTALIDVFHVWD